MQPGTVIRYKDYYGTKRKGAIAREVFHGYYLVTSFPIGSGAYYVHEEDIIEVVDEEAPDMKQHSAVKPQIPEADEVTIEAFTKELLTAINTALNAPPLLLGDTEKREGAEGVSTWTVDEFCGGVE